MRLLTLSVENYGPITREQTIVFHPEYTCIVGMNGSGKTWLLDLIAGLTGTTVAFELIRERHCGYCFISVATSNGPQSLYLEGGRIGDFEPRVAEFKAKLDHPTSFGVTEPGYYRRVNLDKLVPECDIYPTALDAGPLPLRQFMRELDINMGYIEIEEGKFKCVAGDGSKQIVRLYNSLIHKDIPVLWDYPEKSLHILVGRRLPVLTQGFQVVITTHSPEYLQLDGGRGSAFSIS